MKRARSLRTQLLSRSLLILSALLALIGALQYVFMKEALYRSRAEALSGQLRLLPLELLVRAAAVGGRGAGGDEAGRPRFILPDVSLAIVVHGVVFEAERENGMPSPKLSRETYNSVYEELRADAKRAVYRTGRDGNGTEQLLVFRLRPGGQSGPAKVLLQMGAPTAPIGDVLLRQLLIFAGLGLLAMGAGLALYLPVLRRTLRPFQELVRTVERIDAGSLDERFASARGQLEIERLSDSFNRMMERLGVSFEAEREAKEQMRRFIADASHELRTPLTSIHGFIEVLQRGAAGRPEQLQAALAGMHGESSRMKKLVEDLLLLAKLDRAPQLQLRETELDGIVAGMEAQLRLLAGRRRVRFELASGLAAAADPDKIKQIVLNLFHNAVQHTDPEYGGIALALWPEGSDACLAVRDNGPGIAAEHLPHVFDRFYRIDASRTRTHGGTGLGLAIAKSLAEAHGGSIAAASTPGEGAAFTVRLPLLPKL